MGDTAGTEVRLAAQPSHQDVLDATVQAEHDMCPQAVPVNVYEATHALVVVAPICAVTCEDVTVELYPPDDGVARLRFWAHLRSAAPRAYLVHEWDYGGYERELDLPDGFGGGVEATLANGQLAIRVLPGSTDEVISVHPTAG